MAKNLFSLFDDRLKNPNDLVSTAPQSLESISEQLEEQEQILRKIKQFETVRPKVDYSDFSNFVYFNSALDYFNVSGEKILNEYPYDGTVEAVESFLDDLDGYQRYLTSVWPKNLGYLKFDPSLGNAYISISDYGVEEGVAKSSLLNPGTGSFSVEFWCVPPPALTGSNDVMIVAQKISGSAGYTTYFSGSQIYFHISSGSTTENIGAAVVAGEPTFVCCVYDRDASRLSIATGSWNRFPTVAVSASSDFSSELNFNSSAFCVGSGSVTGKVTRPLTGSLDDLRVWKTNRTLLDLTSSFNTKISAQEYLAASWRFNETGSNGSSYLDPENAIVLDSSGHRINGRITGYYQNLRQSGSLVPFDSPDLILQIGTREVSTLISEQQTSGSAYDRENDNLITNLLPDQYFILEQENGTEVLQNFLYMIARQFDEIKVGIDQFVNVLRTNYTQFDQAPDALLSDVGRFFGWEFTGNFLDKDAFQYILGKNVLENLESNKQLDKKLFEIKNEFWRRVLINLMHLYKTKGTRESIESLLRLYGVNRNFVRLKEFGVKPNVGIATYRIASEKSVPALCFGSGSYSGSYVLSPSVYSTALAVETRVRFPTTASQDLQATILTGSVWTLNSGSAMQYQLFYVRDSLASHTGTLHLTSSNGDMTLSGAFFDNRWHNIVFNRNSVSSSLSLNVLTLDKDQINQAVSVSQSVSIDSTLKPYVLWLGASGSKKAQQWTQETRLWNEHLSEIEMRDHTLNFQSFGTEEVNGLPELALHWRLNENVTASLTGDIDSITDFSGESVAGVGHGFAPSVNSYKRFLLDYNFIASPEYGWNEEKIRSIDSAEIPISDLFLDDQRVALEFNMIDALNEDISQVISTMDGFDNSIGNPANRFRDSYPDLDVLRENYFSRLQGRLNFRVFADMLEFFDRSFIDLIRRLMPVRVKFMGDEFVVESHMLERPKLQWNYRRQDVGFQPEGVIKVILRD